jgi:hypothetical protein
VPTREQFENRGFRIGCLGINQANICSQNVCYHARYRSLDGSCNNLGQSQSLRGAAFMPFARLQPANYEDGVARMVGKLVGGKTYKIKQGMHIFFAQRQQQADAESSRGHAFAGENLVK